MQRMMKATDARKEVDESKFGLSPSHESKNTGRVSLKRDTIPHSPMIIWPPRFP
jgi:hypothetical protein